MNVTISKNADSLNGVGVNSAYVTLSGTNSSTIGFNTITPLTTAYITGITITKVDNVGTPGFQQVGQFFSLADVNSYPATISTALSASGITLSAIGNDGANGVEVLTYTVTLSNKCLSADNTNLDTVTAVFVNTSARTQSFTTTVTASNTPYLVWQSQAEHLRLWNLNG